VSRRGRFGLTLIELLVVIAVIAVLVGLTLAGVQRVRQAAARARCLDNLRQLGLAAQNHHAAAGHFPIGVTGPANLREPYPYLTWMARLLPYLEQDAIWGQTTRAFREQPSFQHDPPHVHRGRPMPAFSCPLDPRTAAPAVFTASDGRPYHYGLTSYLGVAGVSPIRLGGLLHLDAAYRLADVTDGASNTLLVGERPPSSDLKFGWWYAGEGMRQDGSADSVLGARTFCLKPRDCDQCGDDPAPFQPGRFDNKCSMLHFWSPHPGGANFAFADGSVRFLRYEADPILPALATRAGGEAVAVPD
jgi:prepilin-type processing-associated H-X9-DG protein/prepilin-type N-terminal cleavage/methylation domain-containing protein